MQLYRIGGQEFDIPASIPELIDHRIEKSKQRSINISTRFSDYAFSHSTLGWVGNAHHQVEIWNASSGTLLKVSGGCDIYISHDGRTLTPMEVGKVKPNLTEFDRAILLGPALVLALALREIWSLHASAAVFQNQVIAFLGESGQGKSTLAAYLNSTDAGWERLADDILPVSHNDSGVQALPHFPQLKLPLDKQPGFNFPEQLLLDRICVLASADEDASPELRLLSSSQAIQVLLSHTAGTRLFEPKLLKKHLDFCAKVAEQVPVYRLTYPHRKDALPLVKKLLENLC